MIPYNEGAWINSYGPQQDEEANDAPARPDRGPGSVRRHPFNQVGYQTLLEPDGPIYFAGDHVSHLVGWQEGAAISSLRAVQEISDRVKAAKLAHQLPANA